LPHQPNGQLFDQVIEALGVDPGRTLRVVHEVGSLAAASIPLSLDRLMRTRPVRDGDRILMTGVASGTACGAILYRCGS
jgi:3-oxoacyl-[acyl-carrier-protein] synthase III